MARPINVPLVVTLQQDKWHPGIFDVCADTVLNNPERLSEVLSALEFIPTRVEMLFSSRRFRYEGYSPQFKEIQKGALIPFYEIRVEFGDSGRVIDLQVVEYEEEEGYKSKTPLRDLSLD